MSSDSSVRAARCFNNSSSLVTVVNDGGEYSHIVINIYEGVASRETGAVPLIELLQLIPLVERVTIVKHQRLTIRHRY